MAARPYPYDRWPRVSKRDAGSIRSALRALPDAETCSRAATEATAVLGARLSARKSGIEVWPVEQARAAFAPAVCALWLERTEGVHRLPVVCELPIEFGAALVDRALGGDGAAMQPLATALDDVACGVLAYLAARICAALDAELRVRAVLTEGERACALLGDARVLVLGLSLECAGLPRSQVRLWIGADDARRLSASSAAAHSHVPAAWHALPLSLCAHAGSATLSRRDVDALCTGDVLIPDRCSLAREAGGFAGAIELHAIGSRRRHWRGRARDRQIRIESLEPNEDTAMTEAKRIDTQAMNSGSTPLAGDTPIELCLEIARFTLPLAQLSALCEGEVLDTGSAIGSQVSLTAGGRAIARGELVEVDGEIGVRILTLLR